MPLKFLDDTNRGELEARADSIRDSLIQRGWENIATVRETDANVNVFLKMSADDAIDDVTTVAGQLGEAEGGIELLPRLARLVEFQQGFPEIEEIEGHFLLVSGGLEELRDERVVAMHSGGPRAEVAALHRGVGGGFQQRPQGVAGLLRLAGVVEELGDPHVEGKTDPGIIDPFQGAPEEHDRVIGASLHFLDPPEFRDVPGIGSRIAGHS